MSRTAHTLAGERMEEAVKAVRAEFDKCLPDGLLVIDESIIITDEAKKRGLDPEALKCRHYGWEYRC